MRICIIIEEKLFEQKNRDGDLSSLIIKDLERIGDFIFDILRQSRAGLSKKIIFNPVAELPTSDYSAKFTEDLSFTISKELVEKLRLGYFVAFIIKRQGMHTVIESPKWTKGLRKETYFKFELVEGFDEPPDETSNFPGLLVEICDSNSYLGEKIKNITERGIVFFKYFKKFPKKCISL